MGALQEQENTVNVVDENEKAKVVCMEVGQQQNVCLLASLGIRKQASP